MDSLRNFEDEVSRKMAEERETEKFGRKGTKISKAYSYLDKNPKADPEELAHHLHSSLGYARDIIRTISSKSEGQNTENGEG